MASDALTIGNVQKTEGDVVRAYCDFGNNPEVISLLTDADGNYDPDAVAFSTTSVTISGTGAPTVAAVQLDYNYQLSARLSGGDPGNYSLKFTVGLASGGIIISRTGNVEVVGV